MNEGISNGVVEEGDVQPNDVCKIDFEFKFKIEKNIYDHHHPIFFQCCVFFFFFLKKKQL